MRASIPAVHATVSALFLLAATTVRAADFMSCISSDQCKTDAECKERCAGVFTNPKCGSTSLKEGNVDSLWKVCEEDYEKTFKDKYNNWEMPTWFSCIDGSRCKNDAHCDKSCKGAPALGGKRSCQGNRLYKTCAVKGTDFSKHTADDWKKFTENYKNVNWTNVDFENTDFTNHSWTYDYQHIGGGSYSSTTTGPSTSDPCFSRDTFALSASGEPVPMASLRSGDIVRDGPSSTTRIIVNQHRETTFKSVLVEIEHADGKVALTPDHVLAVDGAFVAARNAAPGSKLGASEVSRVAYTAGEVINPLTTSGKILTQGGVLASTYPEWIAEYMLSSALVPLPLSLSNLASYLFPETTQAYYDALVEPLVTVAHPKHLKTALPAALYPAGFFAGDVALAGGFVAFSLASPVGLAAVIAVAALRKARK